MPYYLYILTNTSHHTLYTGVTNDITFRINTHKSQTNSNSFTAKYNLNKLLYYEVFQRVEDAIAAEKKVKGWTRKKKMDLIKTINSEFKDLSDNG